jgi:hypothetical protein
MNTFTSDEDEEAAVFFHQNQQRPRKKREVLPSGMVDFEKSAWKTD